MRYLVIIFLISTSITASAQEKYMFVFLNIDNNAKELSDHTLDSLQNAHLKNIKRLTDEGKILVAGPFEGGGGILILNTASAKEARQWIADDPAIHTGIYYIEILPWVPRKGSVCAVPKDAKMAQYTFIRYNSYITKFNVRHAPELFRAHDVYVKQVINTGNVISEGVFDNSDGSTMIMSGEVEKAVIMADPAVTNGILEPEIHTLWIGEGSFCN